MKDGWCKWVGNTWLKSQVKKRGENCDYLYLSTSYGESIWPLVLGRNMRFSLDLLKRILSTEGTMWANHGGESRLWTSECKEEQMSGWSSYCEDRDAGWLLYFRMGMSSWLPSFGNPEWSPQPVNAGMTSHHGNGWGCPFSSSPRPYGQACRPLQVSTNVLDSLLRILT